MRAVRVMSQNPESPLDGLEIVDVPAPEPRPGWVSVDVRASSVNPHDLWTLRGVGHPADRVPMTLGCEAAGVTSQGREVLLAPVMGDADAGGGDVTMDPQRHILSERVDGGLAQKVAVPSENLIDKPDWLSFEQAGVLAVAWGTAYRMLFTRARLRPGQRVLVQGSSGGVSSAAIALAVAAGCKVYATGRTTHKREFAASLGAHGVFESGARLPERVDVVVDTVGAATWKHSVMSVEAGGTIVTCGNTSGDPSPALMTHIFYRQLSVIGSTGCTPAELRGLLSMMEATGVRPVVDAVVPLEDVRDAFARLDAGDVCGKIAVTV
ncbi:zinc-binding dehydrogenase [Dermatophilus congolensis]|nr:zinc-binding dehydrogenase [Dermatophilus congolensis]MBO3151670.1 zinc-binding dehydrogenase [Dermatophilus congolensis]MBO3161330.1 zinc-binding dehydrogenase [Dermatophilus congolensis]MBO3162951.1 zinc-binding dehydrogenase [Dermatophilus congolensis]MBO3176503.1 zinc-binding dehydrogenase [Dermatophilus congolensis]